MGEQDRGKRQSKSVPHYVMLLCLTLSLPSPMTTILQKIPVSVHCVSTSPRFIPIAQALERGAGQEEQLQVIASVETALFAGGMKE